MKAGTVLYFLDFKFKDNTTKDKLVIILNTPKENEPYLLCTVTSQRKFRKSNLGCHSNENYYFIDEKKDKFYLDTWVVFHIIYPFQHDVILSALLKNKLFEKFELEETLWNAIKKCVMNSIDIDQDYIELIKNSPTN